MKHLSAAFILLFVLTVSAHASGYNYLKIDGYDRQTANYFYGIENDVDGENYYVNIGVYDIKNDKLKHIFPIDNRDQITGFYYQIGFSNELDKQMINTDDLEVQNTGKSIKPDYTKASKNLIIITYSKKDKKHSVWICPKSGDGLRKITAYGEKSRVEIDTYFNKILVIKTDKNQMRIDSYPY